LHRPLDKWQRLFACVFVVAALAHASTAHSAPPVANPDTYNARPGQALVIGTPGFLGNDTDADGDTLTATIVVDGVDNGILSAFPNGSFSYTSNAGFTGIDSFIYQVSDGNGGIAQATVTINVVNAAPVANPNTYNARPGQPLSIAAPGILGNDTDADGDPLTATSIVDGVDHGSLSAFPNGSFTYTSDAGYVGVDTFIYSISDGFGGTAQATVTINVVNTAPVANPNSYQTPPGVTLVVGAPGFLGNDADADGDAITAASIVDDVDHGTLSAFPDGNFNYAPDAGYVGVDTFIYTISDGFGGATQATVTLYVGVSPPAPPPATPVPTLGHAALALLAALLATSAAAVRTGRQRIRRRRPH